MSGRETTASSEADTIGPFKVPAAARGLRLYRMQGERLIGCELVMFRDGASAVETTLRRAAISGRVEVAGEIRDHWADIYGEDHSWFEQVALDADSYRALKTRWMRCRVEREP